MGQEIMSFEDKSQEIMNLEDLSLEELVSLEVDWTPEEEAKAKKK